MEEHPAADGTDHPNDHRHAPAPAPVEPHTDQQQGRGQPGDHQQHQLQGTAGQQPVEIPVEEELLVEILGGHGHAEPLQRPGAFHGLHREKVENVQHELQGYHPQLQHGGGQHLGSQAQGRRNRQRQPSIAAFGPLMVRHGGPGQKAGQQKDHAKDLKLQPALVIGGQSHAQLVGAAGLKEQHCQLLHGKHRAEDPVGPAGQPPVPSGQR